MEITYTFWLSVAAGLVVIELLTLSFYLLMLSFGALVGAAFAYFGFSPQIQLFMAGLSAVALVTVWHKYKTVKNISYTKENFKLDLGESVHVALWDENKCAKVNYRGSVWNARCIDSVATEGTYYVQGVDGVDLLLSKNKS